ncbi:MAG: hypothetical protein LIO69_04955 [Oscillospiraceae bacterium]|nr:hypothetical protein [Oscillospiraceae bacterium]
MAVCDRSHRLEVSVKFVSELTDSYRRAIKQGNSKKSKGGGRQCVQTQPAEDSKGRVALWWVWATPTCAVGTNEHRSVN